MLRAGETGTTDHFRPAAPPVTVPDSRLPLSGLVAGDVIPRLLMALRHDPAGPRARPAERPAPPNRADIERIAEAAIDPDDQLLWRLVAAADAAGQEPEVLLLDLLAPAARLLGEWWSADRCDFFAVTAGLGRIQSAVQRLSGTDQVDRPGPCRQALFAVVPGEDHSFGSQVAEELFRRDGWCTHRPARETAEGLLAAVGNSWFDCLALSASTDAAVAAIPGLLPRLRAAARNRDLCVLVGGPPFLADPALVRLVGADGGGEARTALALADARAVAAHSALG